MHFGHNNHKYLYSWGTKMLNISCCEKILGLLTDDNLTFKDHVYCLICFLKHMYFATFTDKFFIKCTINTFLTYYINRSNKNL